MSNITTTFGKDRDGWGADTQIDLTPYGLPGRIIRLSTNKWSRGGLWSHALSAKIEDGFMSWAMFSDWEKTMFKEPKTRCTEKAVRDMHARALSTVDDLIAECVAFYAKKEAA